MFVKPAAGYLVRDPWTKQPLPADGAEVPENSFWLRRLKAGDVLAASAPEVANVSVDMLQNVQIPDSMPAMESDAGPETER